MFRRVFLMLLCIAAIGRSPALAATFTVTTTADAGAGSLRQAIADANGNPGLDQIRFNIGAGGPQVITITSSALLITDGVDLDATSQPGFAGTPIITLDGNGLVFQGLVISSPTPSTIRGLVIVAFPSEGIRVGGGGGATIAGNYVGVDASGLVADGNGDGIIVSEDTDGVVIGGPTPQDRNVISGNANDGIGFSGFFGATSDNNTVQGNFIGVDAAGLNDLGNGFNGIAIDGGDNHQIGGIAAGTGNVISGNSGFGIRISSVLISSLIATGNVVQGNRIGTDIAGNPVPNGLDGVALFNPQQTTVGGTVAGAGNVISGNGENGIEIHGFGNRVLGNSIDLNGALGIDIDGDGVTANDAGDADPGSNSRQNFPLLTAATVNGSTAVTGALDSTPTRTFRIEFFNSPASDPSGFGEGRTFLGFANVMTDGSGDAAFVAILLAVPAGTVVTATATDLTSLDTSELSGAIVAVLGPAQIIPIPSLSQWGLAVMAVLMALGGVIVTRVRAL